MRGQFSVQVTSATRVNAITGMWPEDRQRALLEVLIEEPSTLAGAELTEMLTMALQDLEPVECGIALLEFGLGKEMTPGMRDDVSRDMGEATPWETHSHLQWHRRIFDAGYLLYEAHGGSVMRPYGRRIEATVTAKDDAAKAILAEDMTPALAVRLLAACAPESTLDRLFEDELEANVFADAEHVAWHCSVQDRDGDTLRLVVEGSEGLWSAVKPDDAFDVAAWPDRPEEEDDD